MNLDKRMKEALENSKHLPLRDCDKYVIMSDCHRGDGGWSDNFSSNQHLYYFALTSYFEKGFSYIELGDGDELWKNRSMCSITLEHSHVFWLLGEFFKRDRLHFVFGNHDMVKKSPKWLNKNFFSCYDERSDKEIPLFPGARVYESVVLNSHSGKITLVHGHQADFFNDRLWKLGRFLVRYLWKPLEVFGVNDPTGTAKNYKRRSKVGNKLSVWCEKRNSMLISGHTHRPVFPKPGEIMYFNDGSTVHPRCITAMEIENDCVSLVKWSVLTHDDGTLAVIRDILAGPEKLEKYFANHKR